MSMELTKYLNGRVKSIDYNIQDNYHRRNDIIKCCKSQNHRLILLLTNKALPYIDNCGCLGISFRGGEVGACIV